MESKDTKKCICVQEAVQMLRGKNGENYYAPLIASGLDVSNDFRLTKGIVMQSSLINLDFFSIADSLNTDVFHDLPEGVITYCLKYFFEYVIEKKYLSLFEIQNKIKSYDFGKLDSEYMPSNINLSNESLGQSGLQLSNLFYRILYIFGDLKKKEDKTLLAHFTILSLLLRIYQIVSSYVITEINIKELENKIEKLLKMMIETYSIEGETYTLKPKMHMLLHYPDTIRRIGPVIFSSTLRYEAKHHFFKQLASKFSNQINVLRYLAERHQEWWAFFWQNLEKFFTIEIGKSYICDTSLEIFESISLNENDLVYRTNYLSYHYEYSQGLILSKKENQTDRICFFKIQNIYFKENLFNKREFFFNCCKIDTKYDQFYRAFEIVRVHNESNLFNLNEFSENFEPFESLISVENFKSYIFCKKNNL